MSLQTFVLSENTASQPVGPFIQQAATGRGVEVRDGNGKVVAYVLPAHDEEAWLSAESQIYFEQHKNEIEAAGDRDGGITTAELLKKAAAFAPPAA
jgi:hypothetical protein